MSNVHLSIAGVSYNTDDQSLEEAFSKYGQVLDGNLLDPLLFFFVYFFLGDYNVIPLKSFI